MNDLLTKKMVVIKKLNKLQIKAKDWPEMLN